MGVKTEPYQVAAPGGVILRTNADRQAQAWSVAEVLRCWVKTGGGAPGPRGDNIATFAGRDASQGV